MSQSVIPEIIAVTSVNDNVTASSPDNEIIAATTGKSIYIVSIQMVNASITAFSRVDVKDGTTVVKKFYLAPVGGGVVVTYPTERPLKLTAGNALNMALDATGSIFVNVDYYVA